MALKAGAVRQKADRAVIGNVTKVNDANLSKIRVVTNQDGEKVLKGGYLYVINLELKGQRGGNDGNFYYLYRPEWFGATFDPETDFEPLTVTDEESGMSHTVSVTTLDRMYRQYVSDKKGVSALEALLASTPNGFAKLAETLDALTTEPTAKGVEQILKEVLAGVEVGYILQQRKDDDGTLTDKWNVQSFFGATDEGIEYITRSANSSKRRNPLVLTWDE
jgi:hypothetical protein